MRINVYAEELTNETEVVTKQVDGRTFYAVRLFLKSSEALHFNANDDDRSAITFWVPWINGGNKHELLITMMHALVDCAKEAKFRDGEKA